MIDKSHTHMDLKYLEEYEDFYNFKDVYLEIK